MFYEKKRSILYYLFNFNDNFFYYWNVYIKIYLYVCQMAVRSTFTYRDKKNIKRKGIHAKSKTSTNKNSTNYVKKYVGQGR